MEGLGSTVRNVTLRVYLTKFSGCTWDVIREIEGQSDMVRFGFCGKDGLRGL